MDSAPRGYAGGGRGDGTVPSTMDARAYAAARLSAVAVGQRAAQHTGAPAGRARAWRADRRQPPADSPAPRRSEPYREQALAGRAAKTLDERAERRPGCGFFTGSFWVPRRSRRTVPAERRDHRLDCCFSDAGRRRIRRFNKTGRPHLDGLPPIYAASSGGTRRTDCSLRPMG